MQSCTKILGNTSIRLDRIYHVDSFDNAANFILCFTCNKKQIIRVDSCRIRGPHVTGVQIFFYKENDSFSPGFFP